jgi:ABC-type amino acid transport substrate-binding protein
MKRLLILALLGMSLCGGARAEDNVVLTGTLAAINQRGSILIGYRDSAPPFSFLNPGHQPIGFALDLCHGIAEDVAQSLNRDLVEADAPAWQSGVRIVYVPVTGDERISKIVAGAIDLECGSTTANAERITGDYLSFEPYAIGFRRDDTPFADLVRDSFARMATEGTLNRLYTRWLMDRLPNGKTLGVPISPQLAEMYRALGQPD